MESLGHMGDNGIRYLPGYARGLGTLPDPAIDSALAELFSDDPRGLPTTAELATELAAAAPALVLPPVIDYGMFEAAQYHELLRSASSNRPQRLASSSAAQAIAQPAGLSPYPKLLALVHPRQNLHDDFVICYILDLDIGGHCSCSACVS